jgi:hypothetical protein
MLVQQIAKGLTRHQYPCYPVLFWHTTHPQPHLLYRVRMNDRERIRDPLSPDPYHHSLQIVFGSVFRHPQNVFIACLAQYAFHHAPEGVDSSIRQCRIGEVRPAITSKADYEVKMSRRLVRELYRGGLRNAELQRGVWTLGPDISEMRGK